MLGFNPLDIFLFIRSLFLTLLFWLSAVLTGSGPFVPVGPSTCAGMEAYLGIPAMPAGMTCQTTPAMEALVAEPDSYDAEGTITPAAADAWLATLPPGFNLTQQPCWTDGDCSFPYIVVRTVNGVRQTATLAINTRPEGGDVAVTADSTRWKACSEQDCPAGPLPAFGAYSSSGCAATMALIDNLAGAPSGVTPLGDSIYTCYYEALPTHPWYEVTYGVDTRSIIDDWIAGVGTAQSVTCPVASPGAGKQLCWRVTTESSGTVDITWRQDASESFGWAIIRVTQ